MNFQIFLIKFSRKLVLILPKLTILYVYISKYLLVKMIMKWNLSALLGNMSESGTNTFPNIN